jgi:hypothetical protein
MYRILVVTMTVGLAVAAVAPSHAETVEVLTYNVRGLPPQVIEDRAEEIAAIATRLEDFHTPGGSYAGGASLVELQELFYQPYYDTITDDETISYAHVTPKNNGGPAGIGDGLNTLSDYPFENLVRTPWSDCFGTLGASGSDCDTNKGFSRAVYEFGVGAVVHVYNLHADAGQDTGSRAARRANITQLVTAMNASSPDEVAVIVMGDTNSLYTRSGNDNIETILTGTGVTDVWVELKHDDVVPPAGPEVNSGCAADPAGSECERIDKIFYRSGDTVILTPVSYTVPDDLFSGDDLDLSDHKPVAATFEIAIVSTTTTTLPVEIVCGDANGDGEIKTADALQALRTAVGSGSCPPTRCDYNGDGDVKTGDALAILKTAVGTVVTPNCPLA